MEKLDIQSKTTLHNGVKMPWFGFGTFLIDDGEEVDNSVYWALEAGYRSIDTAAIYRNERGVGKAIKDSALKREDIFVTSKVWNASQGFESTLKAYDESLKKLKLDYLDLYLVHWPVKGKFIETWRAIEKLYNEKKVKAIGVSNFMINHLNELLSNCSIVPMVNQVEYHPFLQQPELFNYCKEHKIQLEAWGPLMQGKISQAKLLEPIAEKYKKSLAQIALRWEIQKGVIIIPKSQKKERIIENTEIFDFQLTVEEMKLIDSLDRNKRFGPDPNNFNF